MKRAAALAGAAVTAEALLIHLGRTKGSSPQERARALPGDGIVECPDVVTDHAVTIAAPTAAVWPWLAQMGWHRGGWYTARWVDRVLFPANWPSTDQVLPEHQHLAVGDFVPDGAPETGCGFVVEAVEPQRHLVLRSCSHLPRCWRDRGIAALDWSWAFLLNPIDGDQKTRLHVRSRWTTSPWWMTLGTRLVIVPADLVMAHSMLHGLKARAEAHHRRSEAGTGQAGVIVGG